MVLPWMSIVAIVMSHPSIVATRATRSRLGVDVVVAVLASDMVDGPCQGSGLAGAGTLVSPTLPGIFPHRAENLPNSPGDRPGAQMRISAAFADAITIKVGCRQPLLRLLVAYAHKISMQDGKSGTRVESERLS
jgi:hypothetical protein